ncbi:MAG: hypothetical protein V4662_13095 [Verrucomicrobiota bacterium]
MTPRISSTHALKASRQQGFTLVLTLLAVAAMLLIVLGLFTNVTSESSTARHYNGAVHAQMAVRSGLSRVETLLERGTWSDDYLVLEHPQNPPTGASFTEEQWRQRKPVVTLSRARISGSTDDADTYTATWEHTPLISGVAPPPVSEGTPSFPTTALAARNDPVTAQPNQTAVHLPKRLPWQVPQDTFWEVIYEDQDDDNDPDTPKVRVPVARYCFYVEDMQGMLSQEHAGNPGIDGQQNATGVLTRSHERERFQTLEDNSTLLISQPRLWYAGLAPGLRTPDDDPLTDDTRWATSQAALYSVVAPLATIDSTPVDNHFMAARWFPRTGTATPQYASLLLGPDSWKTVLSKEDTSIPWSSFLTRERGTSTDVGRFTDGPARRLEENTVSGVQSYQELPLVPVEPGVFAHPREPRLNLNRILAELQDTETAQGLSRSQKAALRTAAVNKIVTKLQRHLTDFQGRGAGLPMGGAAAYLQNLAASMIDYADLDCLPTTDPASELSDDPAQMIASVDAGNYRGIDSYPLVNESFLMNRWHGSTRSGDSFKVKISVQFFYELWNMTNRPVTGSFQAEYSNYAKMQIGPGNEQVINQFDKIPVGKYEPLLENGVRWMQLHPGLTAGDPYDEDIGGVNTNVSNVTIMPNQHLVLGSRPVIFEFNGGDAIISPVGPAPTLMEDFRSHYRIRFKPSIVVQGPRLLGESTVAPAATPDWVIMDRTRAPLDRKSRGETSFRNNTHNYVSSATTTGFGYVLNGDPNTFRNNLGDPRSGFLFGTNLLQAANGYSGNTSPGGRNIRRSIGTDKFYREAIASKWPDRGHDTGTLPYEFAGTKPGGGTNGDHVKPTMVTSVYPTSGASLQATMALAPQRISNAGRYFSVTELGHVCDPLFIDPDTTTPSTQRESSISDRGWMIFWDLGARSTSSSDYYAGGTLRIGRPEFSRWRTNSTTGGLAVDRRADASALLDVFHAGISTVGSTREGARAAANKRDLTGMLTSIQGHVNLNTASLHTLRSLCAGAFKQGTMTTADPALTVDLQTPRSTGTSPAEADLMAEAIIRGRPYLSPSQLPSKARTASAEAIFGKPELCGGGTTATLWHDAGREELFARVFNSSTTRSRNFRVFVTGQSIRRIRGGAPGTFEVLATRSRCFNVHAHPVRHPQTGLITKIQIISHYEQDL